MIKINLAQSMMSKAEPTKSAAASLESQKEDIVKILILLIPAILLYGYEKFDIGTKKDNLAALQIRNANLQSELDKVGSEDDIVRLHTEQKAEMEKRTEDMRRIFGYRSKKIKALTLLQKHIPLDCWLNKIELKDNVLLIIGFSKDIQAANNYVSLLSQDSQVFSTMKNRSIVDDKSGGRDAKYRFEFSFELKE